MKGKKIINKIVCKLIRKSWLITYMVPNESGFKMVSSYFYSFNKYPDLEFYKNAKENNKPGIPKTSNP